MCDTNFEAPGSGEFIGTILDQIQHLIAPWAPLNLIKVPP